MGFCEEYDKPVDREYQKKFTHPERLMKILFRDQDWIKENIDPERMMHYLFDLACNMQSLDTGLELYSLFTREECYDLWKADNIRWYTTYGPSPLSDVRMPFSQAKLSTRH